MNAMTTRVPRITAKIIWWESLKLTLQSAVNHNQCSSSTRESLAAVGHAISVQSHPDSSVMDSLSSIFCLTLTLLACPFTSHLHTQRHFVSHILYNASGPYTVLCATYVASCPDCLNVKVGPWSWGSAVFVHLRVDCIRNHSRGVHLTSHAPHSLQMRARGLNRDNVYYGKNFTHVLSVLCSGQ